MNLTATELTQIYGGGLSATLLNAISRAASTIFEIGQSIGSSIRRSKSGTLCPL